MAFRVYITMIDNQMEEKRKMKWKVELYWGVRWQLEEVELSYHKPVPFKSVMGSRDELHRDELPHIQNTRGSLK